MIPGGKYTGAYRDIDSIQETFRGNYYSNEILDFITYTFKTGHPNVFIFELLQKHFLKYK